MNQRIFKQATLLSLMLVSGLFADLFANGDPATARFSLDNCIAYYDQDEQMDYGEFGASISVTENINMTSQGLYRLNPDVNTHSCTEGVNGTAGMCITSNEECFYQPGHEQAVRFDINVIPTGNQRVQVTKLDFFEKAPEIFSWIDGFSGPNNYPTRYALRVLKDGATIYEATDVPTSTEWTLETFDFSGNPAFNIVEATEFNFELIAYCPVGASAVQRVWDLDDILLTTVCTEETITQGGTITGGPFSFCVDDQEDFISGIGLSGQEGQNNAWVITDEDGFILGLPDDPTTVDFNAAGVGVCFLWNLSYQNGLFGLQEGINVSALIGSFSFSNSIQITRTAPVGGELEGGPYFTCINGEPDNITDLELIGNSGSNVSWIVVTGADSILAATNNIETVDFEAFDFASVFIRAISFEGTLNNISPGFFLNDIEGCFAFSTRVRVRQTIPLGGTLEGGPFDFCIDDQADFVSGITLSGSNGAAYTKVWVITDPAGNIIGLPDDIEEVDFNDAEVGTCLIWNLSYRDSIANLALENNVSQLEGCYALSNSIEVVRMAPLGGTLDGGPFSFCVDGEADFVSGLLLTGNVGTNTLWVITDSDGDIMGTPLDPTTVNFDDAGIGNCFIWSISYLGELENTSPGSPLSGITGCYGISNSIEVTRSTPAGGSLTGGPFDFCIDGNEDMVSEVVLSDTIGANYSWIITDEDGMIIGLPDDLESVNFDDAAPGSCFIYNISFDDGIGGLSLDNNLTDLTGCYGLSNALTVTRTDAEGGTLEGGPFSVCIDDEADMLTGISLTGNAGANSDWIVTNEDGIILALPDDIAEVDFNDTEAGVCLIWNISYGEAPAGLEVDSNVSILAGCFDLSNSLTVTRTEANGGTLTGGPFEFCVDGTADNVSGIELADTVGDSTTWVITDQAGIILGITDDVTAVDFDASGSGICSIWNLSYNQDLTGLALGANVSELSGCFDFSNSITVTRSMPDGGSLVGGPYNFMVDGTADNVTDLVLMGNGGGTSNWIVTDEDGLILGLPANIEDVNFDDAGIGVCLIWNITFADGLTGLELDNNVSGLEGCFDLSNSVTVTRVASSGGVLSGGPFIFCVDGTPDMVSGITLTDTMGMNFQWVVTDELNNIMGLPDDIEDVDFDAAGVGVCWIYNISYADGLTGLELDNNFTDLVGSFALSNNLVVTRTQADGGTLSGGPFDFCVDDTEDMVSGITLSGIVGDANAWIITNIDGDILGLPADINAVDFNDAGEGVCFIWNISSIGAVTGLEVDGNVSDLAGCFDLSNSLTVTRSSVTGGVLTGGPFDFCVDGIQDTVSNIGLTGNTGANSAWLVTDTDGEILGLPANIEDVDFDEAGAGVCLIWNISYGNGLTGLTLGENVDDLNGCFDISNSITVNRTAVDGGELQGTTSFSFQVDGIGDFISDLTVDGVAGANQQWVVTSQSGEILGLPADIEDVNFDDAGEGVCLVWNISFETGLTGLTIGENVDDLEGCFDFSDSAIVTRVASSGGTLEGGPFSFCIDGEPDVVTGITLTDNDGANTAWIVTDDQNVILALPALIEDVNFDTAGAGECLIYSISYEDGLTGLEVDNNISDLVGTFGISNSISVLRTQPDGGTLTGGPFDFCINGVPDMVSGLALADTIGSNISWIVTDTDSIILDLVADIDTFNFDNGSSATSLIFAIAYESGIDGLEVDSSINTLQGCFDLSNSVEVNRTVISGGVVTGGPFTFCIDGIADVVTGITIDDFNGPNVSWVAVDLDSTILAIEQNLGDIDFDPAGTGTCLVFHVAFENTVLNLTVDNNLNDVVGCYGLSNPIVVNRIIPEGGTLVGDDIEFCIDGMPDMVSGITVSGTTDFNNQWVITDTDGTILGIPEDIEEVNFDLTGAGVCQIWNMSFAETVEGLTIGESIDDLVGCFDFSANFITVTRLESDGGAISPEIFNFCIDDDPDFATGITVADTIGVNFDWIVTDDAGLITDVPTDIDTVDFNESGLGTCFIYYIAYEDGLVGLQVNLNLDDIQGCFNLSNSIMVLKEDCESMSNDSIVINEINADERIEIKNVGDHDIDVSGYFLCQFPFYAQLQSLPIDECLGADYILEPDEILTVVLNTAISNNTGELGLYNTDADFGDSDNIIDYVEWGNSNHMRSAVAVAAGIWTAGDFVPAFDEANSIEYDGFGDRSIDWKEDEATFCDDNNFTNPVDPTELSIELFPNPVLDELNIVFEQEWEGESNMRIYNSFGQLFKTQKFDMNEGVNKTINIGDLPNGSYFIEVSYGQMSTMQRFIKIH